MHSLEHTDTASTASQWAAWRALPRLLVSREWRWYTLGALALAALLAWLGIWQLERRQERLAQNAAVGARLQTPPIPLTGQQLDLTEYEFRRVVVSGTYDHSQEIVLRNRSRNGQLGADVLTPLRIAGSDQSVLIDRGWVPIDQSQREDRSQFQVSGPVSIEGIVRRPLQRTGLIAPTDQRPTGDRLDAWFWPDIRRINEQIPYPLLPFYVEQMPVADGPDLPHAQFTVDYQSEGAHWSYAVQWFSFMIIGLVGYAALVVTRSQSNQ